MSKVQVEDADMDI